MLFAGANASYDRLGMAGDHQVFVRFNHVHSHTAAPCGDLRLVLAVGSFIELHPQPAAGPADRVSHWCGVLANASLEDDSIEAAERGGE
jgi:hypothetical protein